MTGGRLTRLGEAEALRRLENSSRTTAEFRALVDMYDKLDSNRERKERYHEIVMGEYMLFNTSVGRTNGNIDPEAKQAERENGYSHGAVIPTPLAHPYWRELMSGDFISSIYDNANEIWQIISDWHVGRLIRGLTAKQRDVLFRSVVRQCSSEQIAECTDKTKRGVNKLICATLENIRSALAKKIQDRLDDDLPVTLEKRRFLEWYNKLSNETPGE